MLPGIYRYVSNALFFLGLIIMIIAYFLTLTCSHPCIIDKDVMSLIPPLFFFGWGVGNYWCGAEILQRLELWQFANTLVTTTSDEFIQQLNITNTTIYASCTNCRRYGAGPL